ncbi:MAG: methyltransferase domain-containing protein [Dehalococcoidia bacterium]
MADLTSGQVSTNAARVYEEMYVPALFGQWPPRLLDRVQLREGERLLDVATGTGIVARAAAKRTGPGNVTAIDVNPGMLAVAKENAPEIAWREGVAESLPLGEASFEVVTCQFGLMFFEDRTAALREMWRVLAPGGRLVVATWDALEASPGYSAWISLVEEELGVDAARGLRSPFVLGDADALRGIFAEAGIGELSIETVDGWGSFPSIEAWVEIDVRGWVLSESIDDAVLERLKDRARVRLAEFVDDEGRPAFRAPAHILLAARA